MADEVPVCDVLCEAMEYLSKLGSNLRSRSENLKEKRISKDKLKNTHAVQKAANKVLLICELSKKSLANVETGVRKVLSHIDKTRSVASSSIGAKTSNSRERKPVHYIEYKSRKLRIATKVPLKHYMSVKVLARRMSTSKQNKYPVYYDCKLYRSRIRASQKSKDIDVKYKRKDSSNNPSDTEHKSERHTNDANNKVTKSNDEKKEPDVENNRNSKISEEKADSDPGFSTEKHSRKEILSNQHKLKSKDHDDNHENSGDINRTLGKRADVLSDKKRTSSSESQSEESKSKKYKHDSDDSSKVKNISVQNNDKEDPSKVKNNPLEKKKEIDSSKSNKKRSKSDEKSNISDSAKNKESLKDKDTCEQEKDKSKVKIYKNIIVSSSDSDDDVKKNKECTKNDSDVPHNNSDSEQKKKETNLRNEKTPKNSDSETSETCNDNVSNEEKPLIRCVNINKLLKPDAVGKLSSKSPVKNKSPFKKIKSNKEKNDNEDSSNKIKLQLEASVKDDEEFWAQKRKQVKAFKPKMFSVDITRLPRLSSSFLHSYGLLRVVKKGDIIFELENDKTHNNMKPSQESIGKVKTALLNDSDSDERRSSHVKSKRVRKALNDSDAGNNKAEESNSPQNDIKLQNDTNLNGGSISDKKDMYNVGENIVASDEGSNDKNIESTLVKNTFLNEPNSDNKETELIKSNNQTRSNNGSYNYKGLLDDSTKNISPDIECNNGKNPDKILDNLLDLPSEQDNEQVQKSTKRNIEEIKQALLKDTSEIGNRDGNKNDDQAIDADKNDTRESDENKNDPNKIKESLLNDSDSDKNEECNSKGNNNKDHNDKIIDSREKLNEDPDKIKNALLHDSDSDKNEESRKNVTIKCPMNDLEELAKKVSDIIKNNLLNDSDSDQHDSTKIDETMESRDDEMESRSSYESRINYKEKTNVNLDGDPNASSKEYSENEPTPIKVQRIKSSLLDESSDSMSDSERNRQRMKQQAEEKTAKKKLLDHSSSSDVEKECKSSSDEDFAVRHKQKRKKRLHQLRRPSSSSSEDIVKNPTNKLKCVSESPENSKSNDLDCKNSSDIDAQRSPSQIEGTMDEISNSSSRKMVRSKAKPSGSSGQSSDNQDASDKDIDGLTNLNNLNKPRRRDSTSTTATNNTQSTTSIRRSSRPKAKSTIGEEYLQAESSSDSSDDAAIEDHDVEDLPPVPISGLNGSTIDHLAKDDLLDDTDSSVSNAEEKADNMDSDEDHKVKSKRRKAHAISSGSEGGTSRKKDKEFKLSDFEDSGGDSSETGTKSKRKKKGNDSDGSGNSSDGGRKKRRRIKQINDSDDGSGSDSDNEGRNKHGRKNIRKVMGKNQLEEATKKAAREEKERIARITERQKLYNNLQFDESGKPDEVVLDKVVLDFDPETKEPLIEVDRGLVKKLKPHQANGIKFMWDACFESVKRIKKDRGSGCILAHCMGLGKTLQVVSLTHTLLIHGKLTGVNRVLVVCPLSTVLNWVNEFRMWLKHAHSEFEVDVYELSRFKQNSERAFQLQQWFSHGGVCVLGYEMFRNLSADNNKKFKKKMLKSFQESLVDPGPDLVVCDEGHLLKNEKTSLSQSMNRVKTYRRIVLTGTPLQNNLKEYYCMVQFVKPNLLGKYNEYLNRFVNPITNGQYTDSTEHDIKIMKRRSHVLHKMLDGAVQRRDYGVLAPFLPPKHEFVLFITLTELQTKLYQFYLDNYSRRPLPGKSSGFLFPDFQSLQRIWTHPLVLKYNSERYEIMQQKKRDREEEDSEGSLVDFIDDDSTPDESSTEESSDDLSDVSDDSRKKSKKKKTPKKSKAKESKANARRNTRANPVEMADDEHTDDIIEVKNENPTEWWIKLVEEEELDDLRNSSKLILLFDILRQCEAIGDKLLVFSQSLYSLDLIEHFLGKVDEATQEGRIDEKLGGHVGSWSPGIDYFRLDGSTSCENRSIWCKNFNREDNPRARLFLISTRAGGLGINLVAANRVVIFDVSWNPSHDVQSIFRVYRFGQKKPCYVYRFLAMGTMEEKIYERQVTKQAISKRVIDEQQIDRHYAENDLAELYKFEPTPPAPRPVPSLPKDRLFAEMLKDHEAQIYKFHEHDSLLENKEEETLSEEERKAAWDDFENEKNRPPPAPFVSPWPMHNGLMPTLLAQQQQLAYAALAAMLRKDMPNINDNQIRDMLPLIYNSNPGMFGGFDYGLMQKMSEIYKYAQPGLMNPMMNPVMNAGAGAGGAGAGGTSGLQYSPPWQRQQQQQQQMRLQQLVQQQNQMGAKMYAGGLGSRDPIAMALQQQRAREIMMGGGAGVGAGAAAGAGRPRGRPPLQPRAPPAHAPPGPTSQDVVNLDSD